jgi:hypothetical protein
MHIGRSDFNKDLPKQFKEYFDKPETLDKAIKKRVEDLKPLALEIKAVTEMPGWKNTIGPFLESESNQINQYKIFESEIDEKVKYMKLGKSKAFFQFLSFINNLVAIAEIKTEKGDAKP